MEKKNYEYLTWIPEMKGFIKKRPAEDLVSELNGLGADGWELVAVVPVTANMGTSFGGTTASFVYYFKRQI